MTMQYVRDHYHVPVKRGGRVRVRLHVMRGLELDAVWREGTITRCTRPLGRGALVWIRLDGQRFAEPWHPTDEAIRYLEAP